MRRQLVRRDQSFFAHELRLPKEVPFDDDDQYPILPPLPWGKICGAVIMAGGAWWLGSDTWRELLWIAVTTAEYHLSSGLFG